MHLTISQIHELHKTEQGNSLATGAATKADKQQIIFLMNLTSKYLQSSTAFILQRPQTTGLQQNLASYCKLYSIPVQLNTTEGCNEGLEIYHMKTLKGTSTILVALFKDEAFLPTTAASETTGACTGALLFASTFVYVCTLQLLSFNI